MIYIVRSGFAIAESELYFLRQVLLPPPLCKGRWHFRKKMTEGLFYLFGLCDCRVRAFIVSLCLGFFATFLKKGSTKNFQKESFYGLHCALGGCIVLVV